jgi:hypothetical protein
MNKKKQNIAIAKACGYTLSGGRIEWWTDKDGAHDEPPDYLNDLNAMREAENILTDAERMVYISKHLWNIVPNKHMFGHYFFATAAQRGEAFLRTLNLWEGNK